MAAATTPTTTLVDRYTLFGELASGGMGTVHFARMLEDGATRIVAAKRLHPHLRRDAAFSVMLLDEARLAMSVRHRNVVEVIDVVSTDDELLLVMEYVPGVSLKEALGAAPQDPRVPIPIAVAIAIDVLHGLQAAHEATFRGRPLELVHRDISPHNLMVDPCGVTKLTDFGVAKAVGRLRSTTDGRIKGKIAYMSPEQVADGDVDARSDLYGVAVVLWEMLAGRRMFEAANEVALFGLAMRGATRRVKDVAAPEIQVPPSLDAVIWRALSRDPRRRYPSARAFAAALAETGTAGSEQDVGAWVRGRAGPILDERARVVRSILSAPSETTGTGSHDRPAPALGTNMIRRRRRRITLPLGIGSMVIALGATLALTTCKAANIPSMATRSVMGGATAPLATAPLLPPAAAPAPALPPLPATPLPSMAASTSSARSPSSAAQAPRRRPLPTLHDHGKDIAASSVRVAKVDDTRTDCNPPYSVDDDGAKHFHRWCFR
jgi:eukaryotic-like serine/threonine-protein kinase